MKVEKLVPYIPSEINVIKICNECTGLARYSIENEHHGAEFYSCPKHLGELLIFELENN